MITHAFIRLCIIDNQPPERSLPYLAMVEKKGIKIANAYTKLVKVCMK